MSGSPTSARSEKPNSVSIGGEGKDGILNPADSIAFNLPSKTKSLLGCLENILDP